MLRRPARLSLIAFSVLLAKNHLKHREMTFRLLFYQRARVYIHGSMRKRLMRIIRVTVPGWTEKCNRKCEWTGEKRTEAAQNEEGRWCATWGTKSMMAWFTLIDNYSVISEETRHRPNLVCNHFLLTYVLQSHNNIMHTKAERPTETLRVICVSVTVIHLQTELPNAENACSRKPGW